MIVWLFPSEAIRSIIREDNFASQGVLCSGNSILCILTWINIAHVVQSLVMKIAQLTRPACNPTGCRPAPSLLSPPHRVVATGGHVSGGSGG